MAQGQLEKKTQKFLLAPSLQTVRERDKIRCSCLFTNSLSLSSPTCSACGDEAHWPLCLNSSRPSPPPRVPAVRSLPAPRHTQPQRSRRPHSASTRPAARPRAPHQSSCVGWSGDRWKMRHSWVFGGRGEDEFCYYYWCCYNYNYHCYVYYCTNVYYCYCHVYYCNYHCYVY